MTIINLNSFKGRNFQDVYVFIMQNPDISYKLVIPRLKETGVKDLHLINSMEFVCAAYAAQQLLDVSTDFSYTVPSPNKLKPFEFCIETAEPEKLADILYILLCVYNPAFTPVPGSDFHFKAAQFYLEIFSESITDVAAYGLVAVACAQIAICLNAPIMGE